jgi:uncharacterized protein (TIGR00269 family)
VKCSLCEQDAFYLRKTSNEYLCRGCFVKSVEGRVRNTIARYHLLAPGDRVAVAVSGGKDSLTALHILAKVVKRLPNSKLLAVSVDEGIAEYRQQGLEIMEETTNKLGVEHQVVSFKELYGAGLEEIYREAGLRHGELQACSFCGVLRRRAINQAAKRAGASKVATGHNLDDEAQTIMINLMRGDLPRLLRNAPRPMIEREGFVPRIKPLRYIPERESALYAYLRELPMYEVECRYVRNSMRDSVRNVLNEWEEQYVGVKYSMVRMVDKLVSEMPFEVLNTNLKACTICGEPTTREVCRVCELLQQVGLKTIAA